MGVLISRVQRELREEEEVDEIGQIADTYHAWRNQGGETSGPHPGPERVAFFLTSDQLVRRHRAVEDER